MTEHEPEISRHLVVGTCNIRQRTAEWLTREVNAKLVTLGPRILRTETAAIASQTIVMALRGEME